MKAQPAGEVDAGSSQATADVRESGGSATGDTEWDARPRRRQSIQGSQSLRDEGAHGIL